MGSLIAVLMITGVGMYVFMDEAGHNSEISCGRGYRSQDFVQRRLATARAATRCRWLIGWSEQRVIQAFGRSQYREGSKGLLVSYDVGSSDAGIGPTDWFLVIRFDHPGGTVLSSHLEQRPV
jgi:hypothetical protein